MFVPLFSFFNEKECVWVENMTQALNRAPPLPPSFKGYSLYTNYGR